jgi:predicted DNA-binding protein
VFIGGIKMGLPKSIRLKETLEEKIESYMEINGIKFADLINNALEKYISEPQTITLKPIDSGEFLSLAKKAIKKHKHAMEKLK